MKKVLQMFLVIALFTTYSCKEVIDSPPGTCDVEKVNYVGRYVSYYGSPSELNLAVANFDTLFVISGYPELSVPKDESTQNRIAKYFNDSNYKAVFPVKNECPYSTNMTCVVSSDSISSIEIISDKDFDATHPAGTNLSDLFHFKGLSIEKFLQTGYNKQIPEFKESYSEIENYSRNGRIFLTSQDYIFTLGERSSNNFLYVVSLKANEVNLSNSKLLSRSMALYTKKKPIVKGLHNIKVVFRFSNMELSKTVKVDFDRIYKDLDYTFYKSPESYSRDLSYLIN